MGPISEKENEQLSKTQTLSYDSIGAVEALYPVLKPGEEESRGGNWLSQAQHRQQALTGLQSLCKEQKKSFSSDNFCQLFSQEVRTGRRQDH